MGAPMNYFTQQAAASRYASARPYIHPWAVARIQRFLRLSRPLPQVLDVGCGTGQSSLALTALARRVVGIEPSTEMTRYALKHDAISYLNAPAEHLPVADSSFPMIAVAMAFHWFERGPFLTEAARVLQGPGWLIIYNGGFLGRVPLHHNLEQWYWHTFLRRYPIPTDFNQHPLTEQEARPYGFHCLHREMYALELSWSAQEFAAYLASMSLVNAVVERGEEKAEEAYLWLLSTLAPLFSNLNIALPFGGQIEYWQKI